MQDKLNYYEKITLENKEYFLIPNIDNNHLKFTSTDSSLNIKKNHKLNLNKIFKKKKDDSELIKTLKKEKIDLKNEIKNLRRIEAGFFGKDFLREFKELKNEKIKLLELNQSYKLSLEELKQEHLLIRNDLKKKDDFFYQNNLLNLKEDFIIIKNQNKKLKEINFYNEKKLSHLLKEIEILKFEKTKKCEYKKKIINFGESENFLKSSDSEKIIKFEEDKVINFGNKKNKEIKLKVDFDQKSFLSNNSTKMIVKNKERQIKNLKKKNRSLNKQLIILKDQLKLLERQKLNHICDDGFKQLYIDSEDILKKYKNKLNEKINSLNFLKKLNLDLKNQIYSLQKNTFSKQNDFEKNHLKNTDLKKNYVFLEYKNSSFNNSIYSENLNLLNHSKEYYNKNLIEKNKNLEFLNKNDNFLESKNRFDSSQFSSEFSLESQKKLNSPIKIEKYNNLETEFEKLPIYNDLIDIALKNVILELELKRVYNHLDFLYISNKSRESNFSDSNSLKRFSFNL